MKVYIINKIEELKDLMTQLEKNGYKWLSGDSPIEYDFLEPCLGKQCQLYIDIDNSIFPEKTITYTIDVKGKEFINKVTGEIIYPELVTVKTNMGEIPVADYLDIQAASYGYDSYEELKEAIKEGEGEI